MKTTTTTYENKFDTNNNFISTYKPLSNNQTSVTWANNTFTVPIQKS